MPNQLVLQLLQHIDDHDLKEASTPRGHDQEAFGTPRRGVLGSFCGDCGTSAADVPPTVAREEATLDAAWARIRTPSPETRTLMPHAPPAWPHMPPQWTVPLWEPSAEPLPPPVPPANVAAAARRERPRAKEPKSTATEKKCPPTDSMGMPKDLKGVLSVGSVGHPYTCQEPCKYVRKSRGCKDGADCSRCHACLFNRYEADRATRMKQ